jgi:hypothetical protein
MSSKDQAKTPQKATNDLQDWLVIGVLAGMAGLAVWLPVLIATMRDHL